jgi:hypothetical protein
MKGILFVSILLAFLCGVARAQDGFENLRCGSDISGALLGRQAKNERVVVIESRHKDLGLKDLGGTEISDRLFLISWLICGNEYMLLEETHKTGSVVRDVLLFPSHSRTSPEFIGSCQVNNQEMPECLVGILDNQSGYKVNSEKPRALLTAKTAWKIDEKNAKFVKITESGLRCSVDGIITEDSIY